MNTIILPIKLNEQSFNVALLHQVLAALGLTVSKNEVSQIKAGNNTRKQVRSLQAKLGLQIANNAVLLDEKSIHAIVDYLKELGLTSTERSFNISGTVQYTNSKPIPQKQILAFDLDLHGVGVYHDIKNIDEIKKLNNEVGGFDYLGQAVTDSKGNYSISFYDWQYHHAEERKKADVVVYAVEKDEIIGRSRLVKTTDYENGFVRSLNIIRPIEDKRSEYEILIETLDPFLKQNKASLLEIAKSTEQLDFTASELDIQFVQLNILANAHLIVDEEGEFSKTIELLYGIGRQDIELSWSAFFNHQQQALNAAINQSVETNIIRKPYDRDVSIFLEAIKRHAIQHVLNDTDGVDDNNALNDILANSLPSESQRTSYLNALYEFKDDDSEKFWNTYLPEQAEFKDKPELIAGLQLTHQLSSITGSHQPLIKELQVNKGIKSLTELLDFNQDQWLDVINVSGVPDSLNKENEEDNKNHYIETIQTSLNSIYPTQRIERMVKDKQLKIGKTEVATSVERFLNKNGKFDFISSRVDDFSEEVAAVSADNVDEVNSTLKSLQRLFQVSHNTEVMAKLSEEKFNSAYEISYIPRKNFIKTYGKVLGGEDAAATVHQRAEYINKRVEMIATDLTQYSTDAAMPEKIMSVANQESAVAVLKENIPNYNNLFSSPDLCECQHCRSVYSPAAYFVELLQFLRASKTDSNGILPTPYEVLVGNEDDQNSIGRRPDLIELPLSCENTNTVMPYIDLVNEVMEYFVSTGSLNGYKGENTGDTTVDELRANPQNTNTEAYRILSDNNPDVSSKFPFSLPYHQPLDVIRTYSAHLNVSRFDVLNAVNYQPGDLTAKVIDAESIEISPEGYKILIDDSSDLATLRIYFGFEDPVGVTNDLEELSHIPSLLNKSGIAYVDLVELVKTLFINPHQSKIHYFERIFSGILIDNKTIYTWFSHAATGQTTADEDLEIETALNEYNNDQITESTKVTINKLKEWAGNNFNDFKEIITLFEPKSQCNLETTRLRTIQSVYENPDDGASEIKNNTWSRLHRFIRLWRKLDWSIHDTDLILNAINEPEIRAETITKIRSVLSLKNKSKMPLNKLAVLWGDIDSYGEKSLYKKLFLNKTALPIEPVFGADAEGAYPAEQLDSNGEKITLAKHQTTILAAYGITEDELNTIVILEQIDLNAVLLNIHNLSAIYRYVVLAKALKMRVTDVCKLIELFDSPPFDTPAETYEFYMLASSTKTTKFKPELLDYIFNKNVSADSRLGMDRNKSMLSIKSIRDSLELVEQEHQESAGPLLTLEDLMANPLLLDEMSAALSLTSDILIEKLSLTFEPEIVKKLMEILDGSAVFTTTTKHNLDIANAIKNSNELKEKFNYVEGNGILSGVGTMSANERDSLLALNPDSEFTEAVQELYTAPEAFIISHFDGVVSDSEVAKAVLEGNDKDVARKKAQDFAILVLLNRNDANPSISFDTKIAYVYKNFLPLLKRKLKQNVLIDHISNLIDLDQEATTLLLRDESEIVANELLSQGFSATYYKNINWDDSNDTLEIVDKTIDFSWGEGSPDSNAIPADNFSVRWETYISVPASTTYTLIVDIEEADEVFNLYLDSELILGKGNASTDTSFEIIVELDAARLHLLKLEYAEKEGKAGVRLFWKSATNAMEIIPSAVTYPAGVINNFIKKINVLHRAAKFIQGFKITSTELEHFFTFKENFADFNLNNIENKHWVRIRDYINLRNSVPQAQALLTDVFLFANHSNPPPNDLQLQEMIQLELLEKIHQATAWSKPDLKTLFEYFFSDQNDFTILVNGFKNEIKLNQFLQVMNIATKTDLGASTVIQWGRAEPDFTMLHLTANTLKRIVKAKYDEDDWLDIAGGLSDKIRENQKQALISYLLVQKIIIDANVKDADGLFEFFLIDVQMGACMDTSRIVQANAAIQLFVNRILLNLEPEISPDSIDTDRWQWMKNYRVWEANRKVFLYPENWLEPEWRADRSEFFKELESHLLQNGITMRSTEEGLRNYLMSLNEVANLDICGMHQENDSNGKFKFLHVFGRTHNLPYSYYYRRRNKYKKWSAWEKVQVDIRSVENLDDGKISGVHLVPVIWKGRLLIFWPEFMEKLKESKNINKAQSMDKLSQESLSSLDPVKYWEIRLGWSEYIDGAWSTKQLSKEHITINQGSQNPVSPEDIRIHHEIHKGGNNLIFLFNFRNSYGPYFLFSDIHSPILTDSYSKSTALPTGIKYKNSYTKLHAESLLKSFSSKVYLNAKKEHKLIQINNHRFLELDSNFPLFYTDERRTYFAVPIGLGLPATIGEASTLDSVSYIPPIDHGLGDPGNNFSATYRMTNSNRRLGAFGGNTAYLARDLQPVSPGGGPVLAPDPGQVFDQGPSSVREPKYGKALKRKSSSSDRGLEFHTFHHPYASEFVRILNQSDDPVSELMGSNIKNIVGFDTFNLTAEETVFGNNYKPVFNDATIHLSMYRNNKVKKHTSYPKEDFRTSYLENICFDSFGANSLYNWELFFHAPLYIATRLSKNGMYDEAMKWFHYIFDPTTNEIADADDESEVSRYWKVRPFKTTSAQSLENLFRQLNEETDPLSEAYKLNSLLSENVAEWRDNPFDPHLVASNRPVAYMKHVVIKYIENLIDWGDSLFRQFTRESVYEAIQLYVIATHILGKRPEIVPKRGEIKTKTYANLKDNLDAFGNALVELENFIPYSSDINPALPSTGNNILGLGSALYFCIPANDKLMANWDTVADRLFKIRNCQDIDGVERGLALFSPAIDPAALIQAGSQGLSLGNILADLSGPSPIYRYGYLLQKANEFCGDVKALGSALLSALEKKDGEELSRLRTSHEANILESLTDIRERQVLAARSNKDNLLKVRETANIRLKYYKDLLGNDADEPIDAPSLDALLTANSQLPSDTPIPEIETNANISLADNDESGAKILSQEKEQLTKNYWAKWMNSSASGADTTAAILALIPQTKVYFAPMGTGGAAESPVWGEVAHLGADAARTVSNHLSMESSQASTIAGHVLRDNDRVLQANLAIREIIALDKQITSANIQMQIAEKELQNHLQQIENTKQVELFLKDKFTNQELYQWMRDQLFIVYKQSYNLAFEMAKKAERAYQYESGTETTNIIQYGYWENSMQGLVAGEKLQLGLKQLDSLYLDTNRRELELSKSISLVLQNPLALIELRETGKCRLSVPEELFDLDFQGHYFRRIKSVSLSIPCIAGPYTTVNCSLRLVKNSIRKNTLIPGEYERNDDEGEDDRFRSSNVPVTSIATSTGQNDAGLFEFNFRDERYLPFEGAGVISDWIIELSTQKELRQFNYETISDVILHFKYTARESTGMFKEKASDHILDYINNSNDQDDEPLLQLFSMKHEFSTEWHKFLHHTPEETEETLKLSIGKHRFPFFTQDKDINVTKINVFAKSTQDDTYDIVLSQKIPDSNLAGEINRMGTDIHFGDLHQGVFDLTTFKLDIERELNLEIKRNGQSIGTDPPEIDDLFLVLHYSFTNS